MSRVAAQDRADGARRIAILLLMAAPGAVGPALGQEVDGQPPDEAITVPSDHATRRPRVEISVARGRIEIREYGGEEIRYLVDGGAGEGGLVVETLTAGARLVGGDRIEALAVWVPTGSALRVESTRGGDIAVASVTGAVEIVNENGSVRVSGAPSALVVNTTNGSVRVRLQGWGGEGPYAIAIHHGSLFLMLPPGSGVDLDTRVLFNGSFVTTLPRREVDTPAGSLTRIAQGGPALRVSLWNGSLHVDGNPNP